MPKQKPKQPPAFTVEGETLDRIILLLVSLQSKAAVRAACIEKLNIGPDQADAAVELARGKIRDATDVDGQERTGEAIVRLNDLYERSLRVQDCKTALAAQKELNRLCGLHAKGKTAAAETSTKPAAATNPLQKLRIINR